MFIYGNNLFNSDFWSSEYKLDIKLKFRIIIIKNFLIVIFIEKPQKYNPLWTKIWVYFRYLFKYRPHVESTQGEIWVDQNRSTMQI